MISGLLHRVEEAFCPLPENAKQWRLLHHLPALLAPLALVIAFAQALFSRITPSLFAPYNDSRKWKELSMDHTLGLDNPDFLFGVATCTYQDSGAVNCPDSQWVSWEEKVVAKGNRSGKSANLYQLYQTEEGRQEVIGRLKELKVNSYRFSIDWSHIQPKGPGDFNEVALQNYVAMCKALRDAGIAPIITLHHFSEPDWFHKLGSFEKEENIQHFTAFAEKVFPHLTRDYNGKPLVENVLTINEPAIEAFSRYVRGAFSPGYRMRFSRAGKFLKGALKAHNAVYKKLKAMNNQVKIGFVHQYLHFEPTNALLSPVTTYLNRIVNDSVLHYFKTGEFRLQVPFSCNIVEKMEKLKADYIAVQNYTAPRVGLFGITSMHGEQKTEMPFLEMPEALFEAIVQTHRASGLPILVTENGISTHKPKQRIRFMQRALVAAQHAALVIGKGNLLGYLLWSFCDNLEWDEGMNPQAFGAFAAPGGILAKEPKRGVAPFIRATKAWNRVHRAAAAA